VKTAHLDGGTTPVVEPFSAGVPIRSLHREDRESLRQLLIETAVFTAEEIAIALELIDSVLEKPEQRDYAIHVYDEGAGALGYYCIGPTPATEGTFDLYWIAVKPSEHGKGIGGALNTHAEAWARSRGGRLIIAETSSRPTYERTRRFYLSQGYAELARIPEYYRVDDDLVVFGKYLSTI
jgi:GNAT superfamily N-acetyltransferase